MSSPAVALPSRPAPVRVFPVVAAARVVVTAAVQVGTVVALPRILGTFQDRLDRRFTRTLGVPVHSSHGPAVVSGVVGGVVGLVWLVGWAVLAWFAFRGARWGAVGVAVLSGMAALTGVLLPLLVAVGLDYPAWLLVLAGVGVAIDLAVVVLLVVPPTRRWYAAVGAAAVPANRPTGRSH